MAVEECESEGGGVGVRQCRTVGVGPAVHVVLLMWCVRVCVVSSAWAGGVY